MKQLQIIGRKRQSDRSATIMMQSWQSTAHIEFVIKRFACHLLLRAVVKK